MHQQSFLVAIALGVLSLAASAQSALTPTRITGPIKNRGTYHVATGTWSRANPSTAFGSEVLFNNTAPSGYYFVTTSGLNTVDTGRIPSPSSPSSPTSVAGTANSYTVDCFSLGYCSYITQAAGGVGIALTFYDDYGPCSDVDRPPIAALATASFIASGLPGGAGSSSTACWVLSFDFSGTTSTFALGGDANGTWDNRPNSDSFGWALRFTNSSPGNATGPFITGKCAAMGIPGGVVSPQHGFQTTFGGTPSGTEATGLGTSDFFWVDSPSFGTSASPNGGCFFFGGCTGPGTNGAGHNPYSSFWLQLFGSADGGPGPVGSAYCSSLVNATGSAAVLTAFASDTTADLVLRSHPVPDTTGQFFFGPMALLGNQTLGDGLCCVGGMTERMLPFISAGMMMQAANTASFTINDTAPYAAGLTGIKHFQHWYREPAGTSTTGSNTSTGISIAF